MADKRFVSLLLRIAPPVLFVLTIFMYCFNALKESDAFYHLATGKLIWLAKSVPHTDPFSYFAQGAAWVPHEWLAQVVFYGVYAAAGYWGLITFVALLATITFGLVASLAHRKGVPPAFTALTVLLSTYLLLELWIPRPQVFAFLFCVLLVFSLERFRRAPHLIYLIASSVLMLAWANMHGSFVLGLVIIAWYAVSHFIMLRWPDAGDTGLTIRDVTALGATFVAATGLCLLNPSGYHAFLYWHYVQSTVNVLNILEWKSLLHFTDLIQTKVTLAYFVVSGLLALYWYGYRRASRDITALGMVFGMLVLPLISIRHLGFWAVGGVPFVVAALGMWLQPQLERTGSKIITIFLVFFAGIFLIGRLLIFPVTPFAQYRIPLYAADFAERVHLGRMFNLYNEGGYLIWRRWPGQQVAIDGRSEVYQGVALDDYLRVISVTPSWNQLIDKYHIEAFFLAYNPPELYQQIAPLVSKLKSEGWVPIYWDDDIVIYVRNDAANKDLIAQYGFKYVDPFGHPEQLPVSRSEEINDELKHIVQASPMENIPLEYARRYFVHTQEK